jgi:hypothetical protein
MPVPLAHHSLQGAKRRCRQGAAPGLLRYARYHGPSHDRNVWHWRELAPVDAPMTRC